MENEIDIIWKKKLLFSGVFVQENRLHAIMDRYLKEVTCKQWLVMIVADAYDAPPDLSTLAKMLGCTRQNIKKLAASLEKAGYVTLEPSEKDGRSLLRKTAGKLSITAKIWKKRYTAHCSGILQTVRLRNISVCRAK